MHGGLLRVRKRFHIGESELPGRQSNKRKIQFSLDWIFRFFSCPEWTTAHSYRLPAGLAIIFLDYLQGSDSWPRPTATASRPTDPADGHSLTADGSGRRPQPHGRRIRPPATASRPTDPAAGHGRPGRRIRPHSMPRPPRPTDPAALDATAAPADGSGRTRCHGRPGRRPPAAGHGRPGRRIRPHSMPRPPRPTDPAAQKTSRNSPKAAS
jgi:hypothetical protein